VGKRTHIEIFAGYSGKFLWLKEVHNCIEKFSQRSSKLSGDAPLGADVAETDLYAAFFDALVKRWDKRINVGGGHVEK
jgi:hypothetical protein